jgi:hypothetical protein
MEIFRDDLNGGTPEGLTSSAMRTSFGIVVSSNWSSPIADGRLTIEELSCRGEHEESVAGGVNNELRAVL